ncbi:MAG TPA: hypothetical protein PKC49_01130 [Phycisphaerae bacterium]|nr:hypothetical protein [Phycisphaerae bacterium]
MTGAGRGAGARRAHANAPAGPRAPLIPSLSGCRLDLLFAACLGLYWAVFVTPVVLDQRHPYDGFRDIASARHFQLGGGWGDPGYVGETLWYPPLGPLIVAGLSSLLGVTPERLYLSSQLLVNWMIPAGLYVVARLAWGPQVGITSVVAMLLAMPWWQEYVIMHIASWQALIGAWAFLLVYALTERRESVLLSGVCGLWLGLSFLFHPLVPALLAAIILMRTAWDAWALRRAGVPDRSRRLLMRGALLVALAGVIGWPLLQLFQHGPILNRLPREFIDSKMETLRWAAIDANPWIWGVGLVGLVSAVRGGGLPRRLLLCGLALTVAGQIPAYLRRFGPDWCRDLPVLLPHQFQMHFQLLWAICVGLGVAALLAWLTARVAALREQQGARGAAYGVCLALTGLWGLLHVREHYSHMPTPEGYYPGHARAAAEWIRANTRLDDVFMLDMHLAYCWLHPSTARKVVLLPLGHSNPRVDWFERYNIAAALTNAPDAETFNRIARAAGVRYCVFTWGIDAHGRAVFDPACDWMPAFALAEASALADERYLVREYVEPQGMMIVRIVEPPSPAAPRTATP